MKKTGLILYKGCCALALLVIFTGMHPPGDTCLMKVKEVFDKMNAAVVDNRVLYVNYTVTSYTSANAAMPGNTSTLTFELITSKAQTRLYSKDAILLKDEENTFTILPGRKTIYRADGTVNKKAVPVYNRLSQVQDSIFNNIKKMECTGVKQKVYNKTVTIYLNERMAKHSGVEKATYCYNDANNVLSQVILAYLPDHDYERVVYDFNRTDFDYKKTDMKLPVEKLVFEGKNKLKKDYQGFRVNDNRINKK